jgi:hypothetical protein
VSQAPLAVAEPKKLWGGRFTSATDPSWKFNRSLFDKRLWAENFR